MSSWREALIRIAQLQRKTLIGTKNRTLKCLKWYYSSVRSMKNAAILTEDGAFALFFQPLPGDLTALESPPPGICHPRQKKILIPGGQPRWGGCALLGLTVALLLYRRGWPKRTNPCAPWKLFEICLKFAPLLRRLFLSVVFVTRPVYFHLNLICFAAKHVKFDSCYN